MGISCCRATGTFVTQKLAAVALMATLTLGSLNFGLMSQASAQTLTDGSKPVLTVGLSSMNELKNDVNYVTGLIGRPEFGGFFGVAAMAYSQGVDQDEPIGVLVSMGSGAPEPIVILPTANVKQILSRLEAQFQEMEEEEDGTIAIGVNGMTIYVQQKGKVAVAAQSKDALALVPKDPKPLYADLAEKHNLGVRLQIQQIPAPIRDAFLGAMRQGFTQTMQAGGDPGAADTAAAALDQIEQLIKDSDQLTFGLGIDAEAGALVIDTSYTAVAGSVTAAMQQGQRPIPSRFSAVIRDDAAAYVHQAVSISPESIEQAQEGVDANLDMIRNALSQPGALPPGLDDEVLGYIEQVAELAMDSIKEGKSDSGFLVLAGEDKLQFVMGLFVSDGGKVEALAKDLATKIPDDPRAPRLTFDLETYNGVTLHKLELDVPEREDEARKLFGETLEAYIGTADKAVYASFGKGSEALLKEFIDSGASDAGEKRPNAQMQVTMMPFLELANSIEADDVISNVITTVGQSAGKGKIRMVMESIENGSKVSFTVGAGVIQAIGAAIPTPGAGAAPF
ncbi:hypothetical protein SV7mr_40970 [Stieleria bergensis]|uniref:Uncharacterized protein n=1 Tax=Stieleria bergensis TaxID=2528025 RepID=A0A517SZI5_9BACT|nr:hypothetical protein SV7mr_40970 [Planctomycetes bacterium SV_7m_r]